MMVKVGREAPGGARAAHRGARHNVTYQEVDTAPAGWRVRTYVMETEMVGVDADRREETAGWDGNTGARPAEILTALEKTRREKTKKWRKLRRKEEEDDEEDKKGAYHGPLCAMKHKPARVGERSKKSPEEKEGPRTGRETVMSSAVGRVESRDQSWQCK